MATKTTRRAATASADAPESLVAERAYYKAEQRGFVPGYELDDWLAAERELAVVPAPKAKRARKPRSVSA